jgi:hypothetical protein
VGTEIYRRYDSVIISCFIVAVLSQGCFIKRKFAHSNPSWPLIKECKYECDFRNANIAAVSITLQDTKGTGVYHFECHNYLYDESDTDFNYSGDFECKLTSLYSEENLPTLLTSDHNQPADWWSRGRFLADELKGRCAAYPEYGRVRTFRLRGMQLRLELNDIVFTSTEVDNIKNVRLKSFHFKFEAKPDSSVSTSLAECPNVSPCLENTAPCYSQ